MSTRGAWGFRVNGQDKIQFNHWDSYPAGLGAQIMQFMKNEDAESLKKIAEETTVESLPDGATVSGTPEWYIDFKDIDKKPITKLADDHDFLINSLMCEWAYIINADTKMLEIYQGYNDKPCQAGRYAGKRWTGDSSDGPKDAGGWYGVRLLTEIPWHKVFRAKTDGLCKEIEELAEHD